jgi:tripartite-type tricarboxylate transporter receptor subunit TctC
MIIAASRRVLLAGAAALLARPALAATWPTGPVTWLVGFAPGGLSDIIARVVGDEITRGFGQQVLLDYRPGGGGTIAAQQLVRARPDGHTVLSATNSFFAVVPFLNQVRFDPMTEMVPVALTGDAYMAMVINPTVPARNLQELIAYAKANPGKLNFGSAGQGTVSHLSGEYLKARAGIDIVHVPYRGSPAAVAACLANEVQIIFGPEGAEGHLAGQLRAIAITGPQRWPRLPDVATTDEQGMRGWALRSWHTVATPAGTPRDVLQRMNEVMNEILARPAVKTRLEQNGLALAPLTLDQLAERARADNREFGTLIRSANITAG